MATITTSSLTFEEFVRLPDRPGKRELLQGELIELPPADLLHNELAERIYHALLEALKNKPVETSILGKAHHEMGYSLPDGSYVQPDVSIRHAGQAHAKYLTGAPAIAIEIVSPSNTAESLDSKADLYFEFGALEVWEVYPKTRHIKVRAAGSSQINIHTDTVKTPLIPGFELKLAEILL